MQYIGFIVNESEYTIPILRVQEIINLPVMTKLPQTPPYIEGVINLRGKIIPVVSLKKLFGLNGSAAGEMVIVVSSGRITFGALVDRITGVITIEDSEIEPMENIMKADTDQIIGVSRVDDRLIAVIDTKKLIPAEGMSFFEDEIVEAKETGDKVEVVKKIGGMGGEVFVKEVMDARQFFESMGFTASDPRYALFNEIMSFMNALSSSDLEKADEAIQNIVKRGQSDLFREIGKITRKLHDSIKHFKDAIDPKLKDIAANEMTSAIDRLQFVIEKTEEAANKTMGIVEKYIVKTDEFGSHVRRIEAPEDSRNYLNAFRNALEDDLTEIITTQSFQDITGQTIKKVIKLVGEVEDELVKLISTFGVKIDSEVRTAAKSEKVSQEDVDDLLKEFGF